MQEVEIFPDDGVIKYTMPRDPDDIDDGGTVVAPPNHVSYS